MKQIELRGKNGRGKFVLIDDEDFERVSQYKWHCCMSGYAHHSITFRPGEKRKFLLMHRLIMNAPKGMQVDHIDRNPLNNQKSNLRFCNTSQNAMNRKLPCTNSSGYKGIRLNSEGNKWRAGITVNNKRINLGQFSSKEEAATAYNSAAKQYFGQFARLNQIPTNQTNHNIQTT